MRRRKRLADFPEQWDYCQLQPGMQLRVSRGAYYHHGIYVGGGQVIHFDGGPGMERALVKRSPLPDFLRGGLPEMRVYCRGERRLLRKPEQIVAAAEAALGRDGYDFLTNNCEHFSNECAFGEHYCRQMEGDLR